jgi:hypothetical protein
MSGGAKISYQVHAKVTLKGSDPFAIDMVAQHADWANIAEPYRTGSDINIPDTQFHYECAVDDERVGSWSSRSLVPFPEPAERKVTNVVSGGVVVLLESPHACEYDYLFRPIGPLQNPKSRARFFHQINRLLKGKGISKGKDILLVNPIPFQTSLFRLLTPCGQAGNMPGFRDAVWKNLWKNLDIRNEFRDRLNRYRPSLVINACTGGADKHGLKAILQSWLVAPDEAAMPLRTRDGAAAASAEGVLLPLEKRWSRVKVANAHVSFWDQNTVLSDDI